LAFTPGLFAAFLCLAGEDLLRLGPRDLLCHRYLLSSLDIGLCLVKRGSFVPH
jgi:hypothetical protein